jgi:hypothetical protein
MCIAHRVAPFGAIAKVNRCCYSHSFKKNELFLKGIDSRRDNILENLHFSEKI